MFGNFGPPITGSNIQVFPGTELVALGATSGWQTWVKPRGLTMAYILCVGAGGAGGAGFTAGAAGASPGGGGGTSGAMTSLLIPLQFLPDTLAISVGRGGQGNITGNGAAGGSTYVAFTQIDRATNVQNVICFANGGGAGNAPANGTTGGTTGTAGAVATLATMNYAIMGACAFIAGNAGIAGGIAVASATLTIPTTGIQLTGGGGGNGLPASGNAVASGAIIGATNTGVPNQKTIGTGAIIPGAVGGAAGSGTNGHNGISYLNGVFYHTGGTGGTSSGNTGTSLSGGNGGDGGLGCGGGGGGGVLTGGSPVRGKGGNGGDGIAIITCF